jgi:hypothetical protein
MADTTLTPQTKIQVGLAVTLVASAVGLYALVYNTGDALKREVKELSGTVAERYISKELFVSEFSAMKRETELQLRTLSDRLSDLRAEVAALKSGGSK